MTENEISLNIERKRLLLENHNLRVKIIDLELINKTQAEQLILSGVVSSKFLCGNQKRHPLKRCKEQCSWCEGNE
jgi:hypothetical protein